MVRHFFTMVEENLHASKFLTFIPSKCPKLTLNVRDFFTTVDENFEINSFLML